MLVLFMREHSTDNALTQLVACTCRPARRCRAVPFRFARLLHRLTEDAATKAAIFGAQTAAARCWCRRGAAKGGELGNLNLKTVDREHKGACQDGEPALHVLLAPLQANAALRPAAAAADMSHLFWHLDRPVLFPHEPSTAASVACTSLQLVSLPNSKPVLPNEHFRDAGHAVHLAAQMLGGYVHAAQTLHDLTCMLLDPVVAVVCACFHSQLCAHPRHV